MKNKIQHCNLSEKRKTKNIFAQPLVSRLPHLALILISNLQAAPDYFKQGNELYDAGKYREAVPVYRAAIKEGQLEPYAWFNLGNTLIHLKQNAVAVTAYKRAAELAPHFAKPWILLGDLAYSYGDYGFAIAYYGRAIELGEKNEHLHYALASSFLNLDDYISAERYFEQVVNENPDRTEAWFGIAECAQKVGDYERAALTLENAIQRTVAVSPDMYYTLAYYYLMLSEEAQGTKGENEKQAILAMENGLYLDEKNYSARRYLAQIYLESGSPWMAIFTLEQGIAIKEGIGDLEMDLAEIYFKQNRLDEAEEHFQKALKAGKSIARIGIENVNAARSNNNL